MSTTDSVQVPLTRAFISRRTRELQQLRRDDEFTDFIIRSGESSFRCHRVVLASGSPVLKTMLKCAMREGSEQQVTFTNIPSEITGLLLDYIYTGETNIPNELLLKTIEASDYLQLLELRELCLCHAVKVFQPCQALSWCKLADTLELVDLKTQCSKFIARSLAEISKSTEFLELTKRQMDGFFDYIQCSKPDPDDILEATFTWTQYQPRRVTDLQTLIQRIPLSGCSLECLESTTQRYQSLLESCPEILTLLSNTIQEAKNSNIRIHHAPKCIVVGGQANELNTTVWEVGKTLEFSDFCVLPPEIGSMYGVCGVPGGFVLTGGNGSVQCFRFDIRRNSWILLKELPQSRFRHSAVFAKGKIYVFGGRVGDTVSASVQALKLGESTRDFAVGDKHKGSCTQLTAKKHKPEVAQQTNRHMNQTNDKGRRENEQRSDNVITFLNAQCSEQVLRNELGQLSINIEQRLSEEQTTTEQYPNKARSTKEQWLNKDQHPKEQWTDEPDLPYAMWCPEVASFDDDLFLLDVYSGALWTLDSGTRSWVRLAKAPVHCYGSRMIVVDHRLFVAGGNGRSCATYDPDTGSWTTLESPALKHEFGALAVKGRKVYLMGGLGKDRIEEYDLDAKEWSLTDVRVPEKLYNLHALSLEQW